MLEVTVHAVANFPIESVVGTKFWLTGKRFVERALPRWLAGRFCELLRHVGMELGILRANGFERVGAQGLRPTKKNRRSEKPADFRYVGLRYNKPRKFRLLFIGSSNVTISV